MNLNQQNIFIVTALLLLMAVLTGCDEDSPADTVEDTTGTVEEFEQKLRTDLDELVTDTDFTLSVKTYGGHSFSHSTGQSGDTVLYKSASTSKLVTVVIILALVEEGVLSLEDHPQDYIDTWPTTGNLAMIELKHLLNLTSGLANDPFCNNLGSYDFEACIEEIASSNSNSTTPGEEFYYSGSHHQVAGLMAIKAAGLADWQEVFEQFQLNTNLFTNSSYDLPSLTNPRLAGGVHWNAREYLAFLEALYLEQVLSSDMFYQMTRDQVGDAVIANSPAITSINEDWRYGFGIWIECHSNPNNCSQTTRVSCPGSYGAYPFIDFENRYFGILARQGALGTFDKGYETFAMVSDILEAWAAMESLTMPDYHEAQ